jgi:copper chaperone NosL
MGDKMRYLLTGLILCLILISGCNRGNPDQLPVEMVWDRVVCEECRMALSDNRYAVQAIHPDGQPYFFDDIGCAILWLRKKDWADQARVWVNDVETSAWIEADKANWIYGDKQTPMGYGFAATMTPVAKSMDYQTVKKWIYIGKTLVRENRSKHLGIGHDTPEEDHNQHP